MYLLTEMQISVPKGKFLNMKIYFITHNSTFVNNFINIITVFQTARGIVENRLCPWLPIGVNILINLPIYIIVVGNIITLFFFNIIKKN